VYRLYEASGQMEQHKIDEVIAIIANLKEGWEGLSRKLS